MNLLMSVTATATIITVVVKFIRNEEARENIKQFMKTKEKKYLTFCVDLLKKIGFDTILQLFLMSAAGTYASLRILWKEIFQHKEEAKC